MYTQEPKTLQTVWRTAHAGHYTITLGEESPGYPAWIVTWQDTYDGKTRHDNDHEYNWTPASVAAMTPRDIADLLACRWTFGHPYCGISQDCDILCHDCALAEIAKLIETSDAGEEVYDCEYVWIDVWQGDSDAAGESCANCNEWIAEPHCSECYKDFPDLSQLTWNDDDQSMLCPECLAKRLPA